MDLRKIMIIMIIIICALSLTYGVYVQIFEKNKENTSSSSLNENEIIEFEKLFDNNINTQGYVLNNNNKIDPSKEIVYTGHKTEKTYEGKYDIKVDIPIININNEKIDKINKEISKTFLEKAENIIADSENENTVNNIYTVEYTAYLNENILSLVIRSTLKVGTGAQRLIIKAYTYNISSNQEISLAEILKLKGITTESAQKEIKSTVQNSIDKTKNLAALGYTVYERDINSNIYKIENSNNFFLGPNGVIYIIYAYGNTKYTSESDIVVIK